MLKRLKGLFGSKTKTQPSADGQLDPVTVYDEYGRELKIPRAEWRDKVLRPNLRRHWSDPDALYQQILCAVNDGFARQVLLAARHLVAIDPIPERAYTMYGIVLMKDDLLASARRTLEAGVKKCGRTSILLTNLAKVVYEQGEHNRALDILWEAVQANPNLENGMMWWVSIQHERGGEPAYLEALLAVAALPGSWRAQLWLARHHLDRSDKDAALALYREVLPHACHDATALTMISGDLGNHGWSASIPDLIGSAYDPSAHGIHTGLNLLSAMHCAGLIDEGVALLDKLYALGQPPFKQYLDEFAKAFDQLRSAADANWKPAGASTHLISS
jgi:tetratricopeptide (TPR) repeat protein